MSTPFLFRMKKLNGATTILFASRHNKRAIQAEQGASGHIDPTRMALNRCLHGPGSPAEVAGLERALRKAANVPMLKKNAVTGIELLFSLPSATTVPLDRYFDDCFAWAATNFGGIASMLSADVHLDEAAPHLHVLVLPLVGGRMNGSAMAGNRARFIHLQNDFHTAVAGRYGLSKAPARLMGAAREKTAQAVFQALRATDDPVQRSALWSLIHDELERDPAPFALTLGIKPIVAPKKLRKMAAVFTSSGKGPKKAIGFRDANRIGFDADADADDDLTLPCVGNPPEELRLGTPDASAMSDSGAATDDDAHPPPDDRQTVRGDDAEDNRVIDRSDCDFTGWADGPDPPVGWASP